MALASNRWPLLAACFDRLGVPVVVVDVESTGGNLFEDRITEVALLRFENGRAERYERLVNPQRSVSAFITRLTGISNEMVTAAPAFADLAGELLPLLRGSLLVAHNSRFDYTFLCHEFRRAGVDFAAPALCSVKLSRRLYPQFHKHNLDSIIERFGISAANRHRALADVLALADFLEASLAEKGAEWENHCRELMNPKLLPVWLNAGLAEQIYALPDAPGVSVWRDGWGRALEVCVHEKAFAEVAMMLHLERNRPLVSETGGLDFIPAVGPLHALWLKVQLAEQYGIRPSESAGGYFTVEFVPDGQARLQARVVPLVQGGRQNPPNGLFVHKKAAKRALVQWAQAHGLCPLPLDILPQTHAKGVPCPLQEAGCCDGGCAAAGGIEAQNNRIALLAGRLPVAGWGRSCKIEIVETDCLSGRSAVLRCEGGALALPGGRWYFDETLPPLLKAKFKQGGAAVKVLEAV
ncbi:3'-5' exonuclease [Neisseria musculi]|uniref:DNA-directed DNA polymerase n=1 Tax=Neisseria musculi TaxID=1815583 RepID=A0A7H1ME85_9NEIS|nr:3'-5' exonuclease [Neisseria musculi]QNT59950.1 exonuclease, DNA polymerase III, epsilon subunit family domain protein [Neisseria musculi]